MPPSSQAIDKHSQDARCHAFGHLQPTITTAYSPLQIYSADNICFLEMSDFNHDRDGVISLFNLPSNLPASQNFRRDTRRGRSWAVDFHNSKVFIAAASSLATSLLFFTIRYFFATPDTLLVPVPANRGASHKGSSRAMTMSVNEIRGDKKVRGYRNPVLTCVGLFIFLGMLVILLI